MSLVLLPPLADQYKGPSVEEVFYRMGRRNLDPKVDLAEEEGVSRGVRRFKRSIMGFCGSVTVESLETVAATFVRLGAFQDPLEAQSFLPALHNRSIPVIGYGYQQLYHSLTFENAMTLEHKPVLRIYVSRF